MLHHCSLARAAVESNRHCDYACLSLQNELPTLRITGDVKSYGAMCFLVCAGCCFVLILAH